VLARTDFYEPTAFVSARAAGVEGFLADEVHAITGASGQDLLVGRGGVMLRGMWRDAMLLNLHSRLAQRVLIELSHTMYRSENDLYRAASEVAWEIWFRPRKPSRSRSRPSTAR
jgi:putative N6-adenine-specific DNA methylase